MSDTLQYVGYQELDLREETCLMGQERRSKEESRHGGCEDFRNEVIRSPNAEESRHTRRTTV